MINYITPLHFFLTSQLKTVHHHSKLNDNIFPYTGIMYEEIQHTLLCPSSGHHVVFLLLEYKHIYLVYI